MAEVVPLNRVTSRVSPAAGRRSKPADAMVIELSNGPFAVAWLCVLVARSLCIVFLAGAITSLLILERPFMKYYADLLRPGLQSLLRPAAVMYTFVACAHAFRISIMVAPSIQQRRLTMTRPRVVPTMSHSTTEPPRTHLVWSIVRRAWIFLFSRRGFFGVNSPYYHWRFVVRETVEIVSQSIQAYNSSWLIGKPWINNLYVAIVVLNCMSTPIIQKISKRRGLSPPAERLTCVVVDVLLDTGTAMLLPLLLMLPYARAIDLTFNTFDLALVYDDVWFINLIYENRQIFPLSFIDFMLKYVAHVSIYLSLGSIKAIVRRREPTGPPPKAMGSMGDPTATLGPILQAHSSSSTTASPQSVGHAPSRRSTATLHTCFTIWGLFLLTCHLSAMAVTERQTVVGCKHTLRPWLVQQSACAIYEFNCYRQETDSMDPMSLEALDAQSLAVLIVTHCPALHMSPSIQRFHNLLGIEVYNSTIVEWSLDAAVTSETHPSITYAFLILTNLTEIPAGLFHENLPAKLIDMEIAHSNLTRVPDDIDLKWQHLLLLYIEYAQLTVLSDALLRLALDDLSIIGNDIIELPSFSSSSPGSYFMLGFAMNPITQIPSSIGSLRGATFNFVGTQVTEIPESMRDVAASSQSRVLVAQTPFCDAKSHEEREKEYGVDAHISCLFTDRRIKSRYPLDVVSQIRQV